MNPGVGVRRNGTFGEYQGDASHGATTAQAHVTRQKAARHAATGMNVYWNHANSFEFPPHLLGHRALAGRLAGRRSSFLMLGAMIVRLRYGNNGIGKNWEVQWLSFEGEQRTTTETRDGFSRVYKFNPRHFECHRSDKMERAPPKSWQCAMRPHDNVVNFRKWREMEGN